MEKKRLISVLLVFVLIVSLASVAFHAEDAVVYVHGDTDGDGSLDIIDVTLIQRYLIGVENNSFDKVAADYDSDGGIEIIDATYIQRKLLGIYIAPFNTYCPMNDKVAAYYNEVDYSDADYSLSALPDYVPDPVDGAYAPTGAQVELPSAGILYVWDGEHTQRYTVNAGTRTIDHLTPGRESTYLLTDRNGKHIAAGLITPGTGVRMIRTAYTKNVRDLGGWSCDGGTVKYGKLFRGGELSPADVPLLRDILGVKVELTLRYDSEVTRDYSYLGDDVEFRHISGTWYNLGKNTDDYDEDSLVRILDYSMDCAINDKNLYFHCASGADRTGTAAYVLEALLGMSQSDLDKDYELTSFFTGIDTEGHMRARNESEWSSFMREVNGYNGDTPRDKILDWALQKGISLDKINAYRHAMIDGQPEDLTAPTPLTYTNQITQSVTEIGGSTIFNNGLGYKNGCRYNSSQVEAAEKETAPSFITGYIHLRPNDVVRLYGGVFSGTDGGMNTPVYDDSGNRITMFTPFAVSTSASAFTAHCSPYVYDSVNHVLTQFTWSHSTDGWMKFTLAGRFDPQTTIITINEEI